MIQMETILGFDPLSKEIKVFEIDVTPSIAQSSNQNNRLLSPSVRLNCLNVVLCLTNQPVDYRIFGCA